MPILMQLGVGDLANQPMIPNMYDLAGEMYTTYCAAVGGKAFNGDPLPDWATFAADESKKKQSQAWLSAAIAAREFIATNSNPLPCSSS
jgi:hypothetical protein